MVTAWTVDNLKPSTDRIPAYPLHGTLWEATATIEPVRGTVTPLIPNLNARADNGQNYQALWEPRHPFEIVSVTPEPPMPFRPRLGDGDWRNLRKARQRLAESRTVNGVAHQERPLRCIAAQLVESLNSMAR